MNPYFWILIIWEWEFCVGGLPTENSDPELGKFDSSMERIFIITDFDDFEFISLIQHDQSLAKKGKK